MKLLGLIIAGVLVLASGVALMLATPTDGPAGAGVPAVYLLGVVAAALGALLALGATVRLALRR